jgi:hypothetical protein
VIEQAGGYFNPAAELLDPPVLADGDLRPATPVETGARQ